MKKDNNANHIANTSSNSRQGTNLLADFACRAYIPGLKAEALRAF